MKKHIWAMITLTVVALLTGCEQAPDEIVIEHRNLFPEGLEYDQERGHFLLGSLAEGTVFRVAETAPSSRSLRMTSS